MTARTGFFASKAVADLGVFLIGVLCLAGPSAAAPAPPDADVEPVAEQLLDPDDIYPVTSDQFRAILDHHRGKVVLVNIWTTWCKPCLAELPALNDLQKNYGERGLEVLAVSADDPRKMKKIREYFKERAPDLTSYVAVGPPPERGRKGKKQLQQDSRAFIRAFYEDWPSKFPTTLIFDAEGELEETVIGTRSHFQFALMLERIWGEGS